MQAAGYVDLWTMAEYREPYATLDALRRAQLFEPFLQWVKETLAPALHLEPWRTECGGATWAKLLASKDMAHPDVPRACALLSARGEAGHPAGLS